MASKLPKFLSEMKRRKVYRVAVVYAVVAAGIIGFAEPALGGAWESIRVPAVALVLIGFPIALVLAWAYEVRPEEPTTAESVAVEAPPAPKKEAPTEVVTTGQRKSIVVLPFDNMSPDPADAYFSDGLTEEIITNLSHFHSLRVISRNSAMVLKGTQKDTRTIAQELDVQYVLEGSVRKAGEDLRITAQLIDAASDEHLWAEKYDGTLDDVFSVQESVSRSIMEALELRLTSVEERRIGERRIDNIQGYEWVLKAQGEILRFTPDALHRAQQYLDTAIEITGPNPYLYAGMAFLHVQRANIGVAQEEAIALADDYVSKALELDPSFPPALTVSGTTALWFRGDSQEAVSLLKRALLADPNEPSALASLAIAYVQYVGKTAAGRPLVERLVAIDPLYWGTLVLGGALPFFEGDFQKASVEWRRLHRTAPDSPMWRYYHALAVSYVGDLEGALDVLWSPEPPRGEDIGSRLCRVLSCALLDDGEGALSELTPEARQTVMRDGAWTHLVAAPLAFVGAADEAIGLLEHGVRRGGFINYPMLAEHDPFLAKLRAVPRYEALVEEAKHAWERFQV